ALPAVLLRPRYLARYRSRDVAALRSCLRARRSAVRNRENAASSLFTPGEWMRRLDQLPQPRALDMRIDLCRRNVGVPEHLLHAAQIGAMIEQMARESMAQDVRRQPCRIEVGGHRQFLQELAAPLAR